MELRVNTSVPLTADPAHGHNRWHPHIFPIAHVRPYEEIDLDTRDALDGQIDERSVCADVPGIDMHRVHPLTGPLYVEGAEPGDLIEVEVLAIDPARFGFTIVLPAVGPLGDMLDEPFLVRWQISGARATSGELPGVAIRGVPSVGVMGVAPSSERLRLLKSRAEDPMSGSGAPARPDHRAAVPDNGSIASVGLRTLTPLQTGGKLDVRQLNVGSRLLLRVDVPGALLSVGDIHFAQGDGEICGQAIEVRARVRLRVRLRRNATVGWRPEYPAIEYVERPVVSPRAYMMTTGIPVDDNGLGHDGDLAVAVRAALREMVSYLGAVRKLGVAQACALCSVAVDLRIGQLTNSPNVLVSASLPLDVFDDVDAPARALSGRPGRDSPDSA